MLLSWVRCPLPPASLLSQPFAFHLLPCVSDLFKKCVCTTLYAVVESKCLNFDQTDFLLVEFAQPTSRPSGPAGASTPL